MKKVLLTFTALGMFLTMNQAFASTFSPTETLKLYREPNHQVSPGCDVYTELQLFNSERLARLEEKVSGFCALAVNPDVRVYAYKAVVDQGGTVTITAERYGTSGPEIVKVWDYRGSPDTKSVSPIIVTEDHDQSIRTLYSLP